MSSRNVAAWTCAAVVALAAATADAGNEKEDRETERLAHLGELWGKIDLLHPKLAYADIDWDAALVDHIPKVRAAKTTEEYAAAIESLLAVLDDGASRVERARPDEPEPKDEPSSFERKGKRGEVLVAHVRGHHWSAAYRSLMPLMEQLADADALVLDLRDAGREGVWAAAFVLDQIQPQLTSQRLTLPTYRERVWSGYPPHDGTSSGGYTTGFRTIAAPVVEPAEGSKGKRVIFLATPQTELPPLALALQETRQGAIVLEGAGPFRMGGSMERVDMGEGVTAELAAGEGVHHGARLDRRALRNTAPRAAGKDPGMEAALRLARAARLPRLRARRQPDLPAPRLVPDRTYPEMAYPSEEYRLLALYRFWNIIHYFYPYPDLIEWDGALRAYLPEFLAAKDAAEYAETVAEMATRIADCHTHVYGGPAKALRGEATVPIQVRFFEHQPVVEEIGDPAVAKAGLSVGDVILAVDDEPFRKALHRVGRLVAASHRVSWGYYTARQILRGAKDSSLTLTVRDAKGHERDVTVKRTVAWAAPSTPDKSYWLLDDDTGYAHMGKLMPAEVDAMFEAFKDTKAIIFDLRNYPNGTAWSIAPRLNRHDDPTYAALFHRRLLEPGNDDSQVRYQFRQPIPKSDDWKYRGRIVVLIDERAVSQSEHTAMFFEAATDPIFIGTKTAGANGDVTNLCLPGAVCVGFTGHDVRHADGRQLQRVGIRPHIRVRPTIADIRAGRDRVLETARAYLRRTAKP